MHIFDHGGVRLDRYFSNEASKSVVLNTYLADKANNILIENPTNQELNYSSISSKFQDKGWEAGFYFFRDATVRGSGFVIQSGNIVDAPDLIPSYIRDQIERQDRWDLIGERLEPIQFEDPLVSCMSDGHRIYGHWIVDILPRVWFYKNFFGREFSNTKYVFPLDTPQFARSILQNFFDIDAKSIINYDVTRQDIKASKLIVPSLMHVDHFFYNIVNHFVSYVVGKCSKMKSKDDIDYGQKIYVSRRKFRESSESYMRSISNEEEIEDLISKEGFSIIFPEDYSWEDQIKIFSNADVIVGEAGSGLHNAIFSDFGTTVICINPINQVQGTIAGLRRQNIAYLKEDGDCAARKVNSQRLKLALKYKFD